MKKTLTLLLILALVIALCSCGAANDSDTPAVDDAAVTEADNASKEVLETEHIKVEGLYVDNSFVDEESSSLKRLYIFYTVTATKENLSVDSVYTKITVDGVNSYESANYPDSCKYLGSYYYSSYIEDVYVGESLKLVETYEIPSAELEKGKTITIENSAISDIGELSILTDRVVFCNSIEEVAQKADPDGYALEMSKREDADEATRQTVESLINGYEWTFYVNYTTYKLAFFAPNEFELSTSLGTTKGGTYSIKNGYIYCTYPDTEYTVEIPYELKDGDIDLDAVSAFDVN